MVKLFGEHVSTFLRKDNWSLNNIPLLMKGTSLSLDEETFKECLSKFSFHAIMASSSYNIL